MPQYKSWQESIDRLGYHNEAQMLRDLYEKSRLSVRQMAVLMDQRYSTIKHRLKQHGIVMRQRGGANHCAKWEEPKA